MQLLETAYGAFDQRIDETLLKEAQSALSNAHVTRVTAAIIKSFECVEDKAQLRSNNFRVR